MEKETKYTKATKELENYFSSLGLKIKHNVCYSNGESHYLTINDNLKVRVSDHSVGNINRIKNEIHLCSNITEDEINNIKNKVEYYYFPNKFNLVDVKQSFMTPCVVNEEQLKETDIIISKRVSKRSGNSIYDIHRVSYIITKKINRIYINN